MALSEKERQADLRARRAIDGLAEVRGLWLPPALHERIKQQAARLRDADKRRASERPRAGT